MSINTIYLSALGLGLQLTVAVANPDVTSREYKLMLDTSRFSYQTEIGSVGAVFQDAESAIEQAIGRNVSGSPSLHKQRDVQFFDTPSTCRLRSSGYSFRERIENGDSELTLKYRGPDRYISDFEDVSSSTAGAETKLEADVGAKVADPFKVLYSHSTKVPNTRTINEMKDVNVHFPGFASDYGLDDNLPLAVVGGLTIREHVYRGVYIDLGQFDAEMSVTLWYQGIPFASQAPIIAEISFRYEDPSADYTRNVVKRAETAFEVLQGLEDWVDPDSKTKTTFVYDYDPSFCQ